MAPLGDLQAALALALSARLRVEGWTGGEAERAGKGSRAACGQEGCLMIRQAVS